MKEVLSLAMEKDLHVYAIVMDCEAYDARDSYEKYKQSPEWQPLGYTVNRNTHYLMYNAVVVCMGDVNTMVQAIHRFKPTLPNQHKDREESK